MNSDIDIARSAKKKPISDIAAMLNIPLEHITPYGHDKAKINLEYINSLKELKDGKLILVTAISPTPAGEGKTTTTVGLGDGLNKIGKQTIICLREPSLGPCFGMKGGAAGGGMAQVVPMEDINLHFTGDFHAIGAAHNLLSALIDNHIHWGNDLEIDSRRISFKRVIDMNDRALREIAIGLGGPGNGYSRTDGFDITVASEIMAIFCLALDIDDLQKRIGNIIIAETKERKPIFARQLNADGAITTLLKDAINPNLVQTLEKNPALIHGGPFANIAHGCNSVIATKAALKLGDYVVTEAGFGADLGAEKFFDIKCRKAGLTPNATVLVATVRALKMHGGVNKNSLAEENTEAVIKGCDNLKRHIENIKSFGVPIIVAINQFSNDTIDEINAIKYAANALGVEAILASHWQEGSSGTEILARKVIELIENDDSKFSPIYNLDQPIFDKIEIIATKIYGATSVTANKSIHDKLKLFEEQGFGHLPVCMAKTQYSFSTDMSLLGAPSGHSVTIREVRLAAGAEFIVAVCGDIMTMPGLPKQPAANKIHIDSDGLVQGLF